MERPRSIERVLEEAAGLAETRATAAAPPAGNQADLIDATPLLAERLHALVALWQPWREQEASAQAGEA